VWINIPANTCFELKVKGNGSVDIIGNIWNTTTNEVVENKCRCKDSLSEKTITNQQIEKVKKRKTEEPIREITNTEMISTKPSEEITLTDTEVSSDIASTVGSDAIEPVTKPTEIIKKQRKPKTKGSLLSSLQLTL
jgi:hypothetical protein